MPTVPIVLFAMFQLKFAVITPALITGAFAERIRFNSYLIFLCFFMIFIYSPLAHATWHPLGIMFEKGVLDFAGGTVVHMSAGWAALASALAVTLAAGYVTVPHSLAIGIIASVVSNLVVIWRSRTNIDDTLDVFPCRGVGGMVGMLLTGVFANQAVNSANTACNGLFYGETKLFITHLVALVAVSIFAFFGSLLLLKVTDLISPLRVSKEDEIAGLDMSQHDEEL